MQFKCKMCGGTLEIQEGKSICECEFCGTTQTVPQTFDNEKLLSLHNRANFLRLRNEFDKASITYENIINENPKDAEAHWGLLLCRYGIEYVDDPKTAKKIPTCHRTQLKSIFDDIDYKSAIDNSDVISQRIYQEEAEAIDKIQKGILHISQNEEPYDIFICYKETDSDGKRTRDSVVAQEIYDELVNKNYKVFFAKVTLESKLGSQYEPYIFAALNSAKVMLVLGTKPEYFNAIWVKNEWSRFLALMNTSGQKKYLIPCYRDMDAYDMPEEFLQFQGQDMNKLGFIQDLLRGIDKIFDKKEKQKETSSQSSPNVNSLLRRAEILVQDGNYIDAKAKLNEILDIDPECAKAYELLMTIDLNTSIESIENGEINIFDNLYYKKVIEFGDDKMIEKYKHIFNLYSEKALAQMRLIDIDKTIYLNPINVCIDLILPIINDNEEALSIYNKLIQRKNEIESEGKTYFLNQLDQEKESKKIILKNNFINAYFSMTLYDNIDGDATTESTKRFGNCVILSKKIGYGNMSTYSISKTLLYENITDFEFKDCFYEGKLSGFGFYIHFKEQSESNKEILYFLSSEVLNSPYLLLVIKEIFHVFNELKKQYSFDIKGEELLDKYIEQSSKFENKVKKNAEIEDARLKVTIILDVINFLIYLGIVVFSFASNYNYTPYNVCAILSIATCVVRCVMFKSYLDNKTNLLTINIVSFILRIVNLITLIVINNKYNEYYKNVSYFYNNTIHTWGIILTILLILSFSRNIYDFIQEKKQI